MQLVGKLKDWPSVIQKFRKLDEATTTNPAPQALSLETSLTNDDQHFFATGLRILAETQNSVVRKDYQKVRYNIGVLVFCIWWLAAV
jgi:hypothetical protein